ncbi:MAG: hypothetical protein IJD07_04010, partial [Clostridia bacterium]|nr:hypothetical protein [Clostridia bacterium]
MKRNNAKKLSALICLALTLVLAITAIFAITASAAEESKTLTFDADKANRTSFSTSKQVWEQNGIVFTNEKSSSTTNVADYGNPVRLYKGSKITIEAPGNITQIVFECASSYVLSLSGASTSGTTVTITLDGTSNIFTVESLSAQTRFNSIKVSYNIVETSCTHEKTEEITNNPTCTEDGSIIIKCSECNKTISTAKLPATGHNYENGACTECGEKEPKVYELVTDVSMLQIGDQIIIVATESNVALSTTQNDNNRGKADVVKGDSVVTFGENIEVITLEAGKKPETFAFKVDGGYLYAASSGSNYLRTETTLSNNSSWTITIASGIATIKAEGENTRNWLRYNSSSSIFSCFGSGQKDVSIYKMPAAEPEQPENLDCQHTNTTTTTNPAKCESDGSTVVTCDDCGKEMSRELIPATGHINTTTTTVDPTCTTTGSVTVTCDDCGETVSTEEIKKTPHAYVNGACKDCGEAEPKSLAGKYVIMAKRTSETTYRYTQGEATGSRYALVDSGLETLPASNDGSDSSLIFKLIKNDDGTYKIYVEGKSKYLGWTSSNTGDFVDEAEAKNVTIDELENGLFNIHFTASDGERYLSLNNTATNNFAAWYKSGQIKDLALIPVVESQPEEPECTHEAKLESANVNLGKSLAVKYYVSLCDHV